MPSKPSATYAEDYFRFDYVDEQCSVVMERMQEKRGAGITCEMTVESSRQPSPGLLYSGNFNLLTNNAALANKLKTRVDEVDWDGILTQVAAVAKRRYREGEPIVDLAGERAPEPRWLIPGLLEGADATVLAAGGGSGKSMLALACAITVATGIPILGFAPTRQCPVLYLDWEASEHAHAERAQALWVGAGQAGRLPLELVMYRRQLASLREAAPMLKRQIGSLGIGLVIVDSIGMARGGAPEDADSTIGLFAAIRSLGVPVLCLDHMSKEALHAGGRGEPIGSVYTTNAARRVWTMKSVEEVERMAFAMHNTKANNGRLARSLAYQVTFSEYEDRLESVTYHAAALMDMPQETAPGRKFQMLAFMREANAPMTLAEVANGVGVSIENARIVLKRNPTWFNMRADTRWEVVDEHNEPTHPDQRINNNTP